MIHKAKTHLKKYLELLLVLAFAGVLLLWGPTV